MKKITKILSALILVVACFAGVLSFSGCGVSTKITDEATWNKALNLLQCENFDMTITSTDADETTSVRCIKDGNIIKFANGEEIVYYEKSVDDSWWEYTKSGGVWSKEQTTQNSILWLDLSQGLDYIYFEYDETDSVYRNTSVSEVFNGANMLLKFENNKIVEIRSSNTTENSNYSYIYSISYEKQSLTLPTME